MSWARGRSRRGSTDSSAFSSGTRSAVRPSSRPAEAAPSRALSRSSSRRTRSAWKAGPSRSSRARPCHSDNPSRRRRSACSYAWSARLRRPSRTAVSNRAASSSSCGPRTRRYPPWRDSRRPSSPWAANAARSLVIWTWSALAGFLASRSPHSSSIRVSRCTTPPRASRSRATMERETGPGRPTTPLPVLRRRRPSRAKCIPALCNARVNAQTRGPRPAQAQAGHRPR